jgi:S-(hydroxymethyl)glutathione dehydrogenase/alcohol dehydrogenase
MKTRAAVLTSAPVPGSGQGKFEVLEVDLDEPQAGEVTVKMVASGLCHSDDHLRSGDWVAGMYPFCAGHEGAGVVVQVGPEVHGIAEGDHVVFSFLPACGRCRYCARGQQNLCDLGALIMWGSRAEDPGSFRMHLDGAPVAQMASISTFSEYTTVDARSCVKVREEIPLDKACLTGCGVGTGWGSAVYAADLRVGDTVVVMGIGGIGINAVQGAAHVGALNVIAVDPVPFKRDTALALGATHACESMEEATELANSFTNGQGADAAIVTVGVTGSSHVSQAYGAIRKGGTVVVTGVGKPDEVGKIPLIDLTLSQKRLQGALFGMTSPTVDIPRQLAMYQAGKLKLDELVTTTYSLDGVNQGYEDLHAGRNIRGIILFD